ncbi:MULTISPECIES: hypothetical protein [Thermomonospora]|uniref:Ferredoxin n=1 Tax=Thermomonospora curvata (strain ATCC 19995 / DSM 43183 / JCM 3096 / KCTC 9072 / NBRC 15933 / NCIMB 10081 / Henssen B9) TaxID=471852 RepID=D1ABM3_THECD|nr:MULTISPECIES: hypothetical protein [Thermomonospora]ACY99046.1 hypothetical protein Tcur_3510 [Thermomonospora curvata DSM 43183]PKK13231.1 MAG: ferredoxin [Thermomonospora sp. CIF 1]
MRIREDNRLLDGVPMQPVRCRRCDGEVLVRKASWQQTSIQWNAEAASACPSLAEDRWNTCPALMSAIQEAALNGAIKIVEE